MTPAQILTLARNQAAESTAAFWQDSEIFDYMTLAELEIANTTESTETTDATTTTVAGTQDYTVPTDLLKIHRLTYDGETIKKITFREAESRFTEDVNQGTTTSYVEFGTTVSLFPIPDSALTLKYFYVSQPTALDSSSTAFTIPAMFHHYTLDYVVWRMLLKDSGDDGTALASADRFKARWEESLKRARMEWNEHKFRDQHNVVQVMENTIRTEHGIS